MMPEFRKILAMGRRPRALDERVEVHPHLRVYQDAFWELCGDRGGEGGGPITYTAMSQYARDHGFRGEDFEAFKRLIRAQDQVWIKDLMRKREQARREAENRSKAWS